MKRNKSGVSLIVLVITIIVMIILAAAIIISLSNSGIINKANEAVDATNLRSVQQLASLAWSEWYLKDLENPGSVGTAETYVQTALVNQGIDTNKYIPNVTSNGVSISVVSTLGELISNPKVDYGKSINYKVTVDGKEYDKWQVYYEDETNGYVFLILDDLIEEPAGYITKNIPIEDLTESEISLYEKFMVGNWNKYELIDITDDGYTSDGSRRTAALIRDFANFANFDDYGSNVVGAIGGPTVELLASGWNAKGYTPELSLNATKGGWGYYVLPYDSVSGLTTDGLYLLQNVNYFLASPAGGEYAATLNTRINGIDYYNDDNVLIGYRPVVCFKSSTPALEKNNSYMFAE